MKEKYKAKLDDGREIYIPMWAADIALENLASASKLFGTENIINISSLNIPAAIVAIMEADEPKVAIALVKHFVCQARVDGEKMEVDAVNKLFEGNLYGIAELFTHVLHSQYYDFFNLGLAKANSPEE